MGGPSAEDGTENRNGGDGHEEKDGHVEIGYLQQLRRGQLSRGELAHHGGAALDHGALQADRTAEGDEGQQDEHRRNGQNRRQQIEEPIAMGRSVILLGHQLGHVGHRMEQAPQP